MPPAIIAISTPVLRPPPLTLPSSSTSNSESHELPHALISGGAAGGLSAAIVAVVTTSTVIGVEVKRLDAAEVEAMRGVMVAVTTCAVDIDATVIATSTRTLADVRVSVTSLESTPAAIARSPFIRSSFDGV